MSGVRPQRRQQGREFVAHRAFESSHAPNVPDQLFRPIRRIVRREA